LAAVAAKLTPNSYSSCQN